MSRKKWVPMKHGAGYRELAMMILKLAVVDSKRQLYGAPLDAQDDARHFLAIKNPVRDICMSLTSIDQNEINEAAGL